MASLKLQIITNWVYYNKTNDSVLNVSLFYTFKKYDWICVSKPNLKKIQITGKETEIAPSNG